MLIVFINIHVLTKNKEQKWRKKLSLSVKEIEGKKSFIYTFGSTPEVFWLYSGPQFILYQSSMEFRSVIVCDPADQQAKK